jgi:flagellin
VQNLKSAVVNVKAAESTIRDVDMAEEMANYTKNNILTQAAQAMLSQANQSSQSVLSLLR